MKKIKIFTIIFTLLASSFLMVGCANDQYFVNISNIYACVTNTNNIDYELTYLKFDFTKNNKTLLTFNTTNINKTIRNTIDDTYDEIMNFITPPAYKLTIVDNEEFYLDADFELKAGPKVINLQTSIKLIVYHQNNTINIKNTMYPDITAEEMKIQFRNQYGQTDWLYIYLTVKEVAK